MIVFATISVFLNIYFLILTVKRNKKELRNAVTRLSTRSNGNDCSEKASNPNETPNDNDNIENDHVHVNIGTPGEISQTQSK